MNLRFSKKNLKDARRFCAVTAIDKLNGGINQMDCGGRRAIGHISPAWPWTEPAWGRRFDRGLANCRRRRCSCSSNGYNAASPQAPALAFPCPCFWPLQRPLWPRPPYLRVGGRRKRIFHFSLSLSQILCGYFFFRWRFRPLGISICPQFDRKKERNLTREFFSNYLENATSCLHGWVNGTILKFDLVIIIGWSFWLLAFLSKCIIWI